MRQIPINSSYQTEVVNLRCSSSSPWHLTLFASCWAFFLSLHALEASLFFSFLLLHLVLNGISDTGVKSFMTLPRWSNSRPMAANFFGLAVRSLPSPLLALPLKRNVFVLGSHFDSKYLQLYQIELIITRLGWLKSYIFVSLPVLDSFHLNISTKDRVHNLIELMRVLDLRFEGDFLSFGAFSLNVVLPEEPFLLGTENE